MRTPRGREVTEKAYKHLGKVRTNSQGGLFLINNKEKYTQFIKAESEKTRLFVLRDIQGRIFGR